MAKFGFDAFGAWVLKCDPQIWDLPAFLADGNSQVSDWSVYDHESQRARAMKPGEPVVFWVSGPQRDYPSGVWAAATITSPVHEDDPSNEYWLVEGATHYVGINVTLESLLVPREVIKNDPVLARSELIRAPFMSNPAMLTADEWNAMQAHLRAR